MEVGRTARLACPVVGISAYEGDNIIGETMEVDDRDDAPRRAVVDGVRLRIQRRGYWGESCKQWC